MDDADVIVGKKIPYIPQNRTKYSVRIKVNGEPLRDKERDSGLNDSGD